jgi:hypothetical protein
VTIFQVAETLGMTDDAVRETMSPKSLVEWSVYLNSPFSQRSREALMNGWLIQTIRSIVATKGKKPKFSDSLFPFDKVYEDFFIKKKPAASPAKGRRGQITTRGEAQHVAQVVSRIYAKRARDYKAGRIPGTNGLYIGERVRK